jgi:alcohol dehydrogenase/L-iditol 2-dehydrogenase
VKAVQLVAPGSVVIDEAPEPEMGPDDVLVEVGGVGLCGSDLSVFSGRWPTPSPRWIMGHEAFGTIVDVGGSVPSGRVGQAVVIEPNVACLTCARCRRGWTSACTQRQSVGMNRPGALAERLSIPSRFAWPLDGDPTDLVCIEPSTVITAALRRLGPGLPDEVLVVGAGAQGLLMALTLAARSASVSITDLNEARMTFASELGVGVQAPDTDAQFDLVVDTVGSPASMETAVARTAVGGTVLVLGLDSRPLGLSAQSIVRGQLTVRGSLTYDHPGDFAGVVADYAAGAMAPGRIVTETYAIDDAQAALEGSASAPGKTWIKVAGSAEKS